MKNREIPTAEEFYDNSCNLHPVEDMIEFARLHVQRALEAAAEKAEIGILGNGYVINSDSILNAYPLDQIK